MWLSEKGCNVQIAALHKAPTRGQASNFADLGDLEVMTRVEVKQLSADFTCRDDWPFPDFLVCNKSAYDKASRKPRHFYYLNKAGTHVAWLDVRETREDWITVVRKDTTYNDVGGKPKEEFYACEPDAAIFQCLET